MSEAFQGVEATGDMDRAPNENIVQNHLNIELFDVF